MYTETSHPINRKKRLTHEVIKHLLTRYSIYRIRAEKPPGRYAGGFLSRAALKCAHMLKVAIHWAVFIAVILNLFSCVVQGQLYIPM